MKVETTDDITYDEHVVEIEDTKDPYEIVKAVDIALGSPEDLINYDEITVESDGTIAAVANVGTMHPMKSTYKILSY